MRREKQNNSGFTLVELLVVIVILGILATVAIFAVRGLTDESHTNACASDMKVLEQAEDSSYAMSGSYVSEDALVTAQLLKSTSNLHDITLGTNTYSVTPVGTCAGLPAVTSAPATSAAPSTTVGSGSPVPGVAMTHMVYQGLSAWTVGTGSTTVVVAAFGTSYPALLTALQGYGSKLNSSSITLIVIDSSPLPSPVFDTMVNAAFSGAYFAIAIDGIDTPMSITGGFTQTVATLATPLARNKCEAGVTVGYASAGACLAQFYP